MIMIMMTMISFNFSGPDLYLARVAQGWPSPQQGRGGHLISTEVFMCNEKFKVRASLNKDDNRQILALLLLSFYQKLCSIQHFIIF